jgi:hypothetical protein
MKKKWFNPYATGAETASKFLPGTGAALKLQYVALQTFFLMKYISI